MARLELPLPSGQPLVVSDQQGPTTAPSLLYIEIGYPQQQCRLSVRDLDVINAAVDLIRSGQR